MAPLSKFTLDPTLFNPSFYTSILRFWLSTYPTPSSNFTQSDILRWFAPSTTTDEQVRTLAGNAISSLSPEHLTLPAFESLEADRELYSEIAAPFIPHLLDATNALALAILLDQFPRNLFRGEAQEIVYTHYDRLSRAVGANIRARGLDGFGAVPVWQYWFYMCLEHSEAVPDHEMLRVDLGEMRERAQRNGDEMGMKFVEKAMGSEEKHFGPLKEFGRFPWRNRWLGRESTEAEKRWLEGGQRFGTG